jgi:hypothetical protein
VSQVLPSDSHPQHATRNLKGEQVRDVRAVISVSAPLRTA